MKNMNSKFLILGFLVLFTFIAKSYGFVNSETNKAAVQAGAGSVIQISFEEGSTFLSKNAKQELKDLFIDANKIGQIKEVRVAAWSDKEYPKQEKKLTKYQVDLAGNRANSIETFINNNFSVEQVSLLNMAQRPTELQRTIGTTTARTKDTKEISGAAPSMPDQMGLFDLKSKASDAVIFVFYK